MSDDGEMLLRIILPLCFILSTNIHRVSACFVQSATWSVANEAKEQGKMPLPVKLHANVEEGRPGEASCGAGK